MKSVVFILFVLFLNLDATAKEGYKFNKVEWTSGFKHKTVEFQLATIDRVPCPGIEIRAWSESGYNSGITNEVGVAVIECGEAELIRVEVKGQVAWQKRFWQKSINILHGAKCYIEVDGVNALKIAEKRGHCSKVKSESRYLLVRSLYIQRPCGTSCVSCYVSLIARTAKLSCFARCLGGSA